MYQRAEDNLVRQVSLNHRPTLHLINSVTKFGKMCFCVCRIHDKIEKIKRKIVVIEMKHF